MSECTYPVVQGSLFTQHFDRELFITHYLYWPVPNTTQWPKRLAQNQLDWINAGEAAYWASQQVMAALQPDSNGNYCLHSAAFGSSVLYWPVAYTGEGCGSFPRVQLSQAVYDGIKAASDQMDCVQEFIRTLPIP